MKIPVIINNCNLLTWPREMVERIKQYKAVGEIYIVDNGSTYEPLLEWYETKPCNVVRCANIGHRAPWQIGLIGKLKAYDYYVVTDPDLDLTNTPDDTLLYLQDKIVESQLPKLGLGLDFESVPKGAMYYEFLQWYERGRQFRSPRINGIMTSVTIDTTFAIYPYEAKNYFIGGGSTTSPYMAKHPPWHYTKEEITEDAEYMYYLAHANKSASILTMIKDKGVEV